MTNKKVAIITGGTSGIGAETVKIFAENNINVVFCGRNKKAANKILDMLKLLGNCSNTGNYEYSENDVKKIFNAIEAEVKASKAKFIKSTKKNKFEL